MQTVNAGTGEEVSHSDLVKGFQIAKGEYVLFDEDELDAVKLESTRIIDIEKFVPRASIDRLYWDTPYHLLASGKTGIEAYAVIRAAMAKQNMVAIGRLLMSTRDLAPASHVQPEAAVGARAAQFDGRPAATMAHVGGTAKHDRGSECVRRPARVGDC
jgi:DNA end-binding protein Ku